MGIWNNLLAFIQLKKPSMRGLEEGGMRTTVLMRANGDIEITNERPRNGRVRNMDRAPKRSSGNIVSRSINDRNTKGVVIYRKSEGGLLSIKANTTRVKVIKIKTLNVRKLEISMVNNKKFETKPMKLVFRQINKVHPRFRVKYKSCF